MASGDGGESWTRRAKRWTVVHLCFFVTFLISSLVVNAVQFVLYCTLNNLDKALYRRINNFLLWIICSQILFVGTWWSGSEVRVRSSTTPDLGELEKVFQGKCVIVMNHHYEVDWVFSWIYADRHGCLSRGRTLVKKVLRLVPLLGWAWSMSDFIFLERDWAKDRQTISDSVANLMTYEGGVGILIFPEGTRLSPAKLEASQKYARDKGLPELRHHLVPRTKGLVQILRTADRSRLTHYADVVLAVHPRDGSPSATLSSMLNGDRVVGDLHIRIYPTADLPEDEEGLKAFVLKSFEERDRLLDHYKRSGGTSFAGEEPLETVAGQPGVLVNVAVTNFIVWGVLFYKVLLASLTASPVSLLTGAAIVAVLLFSMRKLIDLTRMDKASTYGTKDGDSTLASPGMADKKTD